MMPFKPGIHPFFFHQAGGALLGCYHGPTNGQVRDGAVLLCYPMGQEYIRAHRAYRQLAERLSREGFPVLRFDFGGCGDSSGDFAEGRIHQWLGDISTAIGELKRISGLNNVCLAGLRLGGSLAMIVGSAREDIGALILWEPVVWGADHIGELRSMHEEQLGPYLPKQEEQPAGDQSSEVLGFPLTDFMIGDLKRIDLLGIRQIPASHIFFVTSKAEVAEQRLRDHLKRMGAHVDYQHIPSPLVWIKGTGLNKGLVPSPILEAIVSWISGVYPWKKKLSLSVKMSL